MYLHSQETCEELALLQISALSTGPYQVFGPKGRVFEFVYYKYVPATSLLLYFYHYLELLKAESFGKVANSTLENVMHTKCNLSAHDTVISSASPFVIEIVNRDVRDGNPSDHFNFLFRVQARRSCLCDFSNAAS